MARLLKEATLYPRDYKPYEDFKRLVGPDGNHFCVVHVPKARRLESER